MRFNPTAAKILPRYIRKLSPVYMPILAFRSPQTMMEVALGEFKGELFKHGGHVSSSSEYHFS
ncbi:hypothetical protein RO3G_09812 [Rhizopus delemar RA 99-880]|uniref:Uncharacterized protein n=1 Tax=Rhizopus delemar (strain RA 99-880 / ATCC MYA-4621 / FGSC 9543 / NRRL 43880) TaxID=246409 RepID=I1C9H2_RHIO9|nr:hypothetical protein RO3G_09812 [Rhizopus delemar RA 99-880]|eukprot:EIE85102.1 hypothetical protein RO3G_09812 [Rhizopus delemar RA 99-880]